jgi:hypothetical protein
MMTKRYLNEVEAAEAYGPSVSWFRRARWRGDGPLFAKLQGRVLYPVEELERFFSSRLRRSTSDPGPAAKMVQSGSQAAKVRKPEKVEKPLAAGCSPQVGLGGNDA